MHYEDEVPRGQQITLDKFRLLPGSRIRRSWNHDYYDGVVREVWSANPEYVLGGPEAEDAGVIKWAQAEREECRAFIGGGHEPVRMRLKKSMWVVVDLYLPSFPYPLKETLYTYDIEKLVKNKGILIACR